MPNYYKSSCPYLVVELDSAGDGLGEGEAGGLGGDGAQLVPFLLGDVLGHKGVLGLDVGEIARHVAEIGRKGRRFSTLETAYKVTAYKVKSLLK